MALLTPLLALALAGAPCGLAPVQARLPFASGETLTYDVDVMGVVRTGELQLSVEPRSSRQVLPFRARARNTSVFAQASRLRAYAISWVDARTLRPRRYLDEADEDGVHKRTEARFEPSGPVGLDYVLGEKKGRYEVERQGEVLDAVSTLYYLRAADATPGRELCFDAIGYRRVWRLRGAFAEGTERVESPAGIFDAVRFDGTAARADGPTRPFHIWFTKDARRLPVALVGEMALGPVRATLTRASPALPPPR